MTTLVQVHELSGVLTVTLDSPANRNALSAQLRSQLAAALIAAVGSPTARVLVLTHTGSAFCSGMDLREDVGATAASAGIRELPRLQQLVARCPLPVIAVARGGARAGGIGLLAAADVVVAADSATFAFSEVRVGLVPAVISVPVLRRVAPAAARELLLTGATFDAAHACRIGLVNAVAPAAGIDAVVDRYVADLGLGGPAALAGTKAMLAALEDDSDQRYDGLLAQSAAQFASAEGREGGRAFIEKRPPNWAAGS